MAATPDETLAEERQRSTMAGATSIAAGLLTFVGALRGLAASRDFPITRLLETMRSSLGQGSTSQPGPLQRVVDYFHDNLVLVASARIVPAIATALTAYALVLLFRCVRARDPETQRFPLIAVVSGAVLTAVAALVGTFSLALDVSSFAGAATQTEDAARDVLRAPFTGVALQLTALGTAVLGLGLVFTARAAMRVGLLTRFMGVLGMIVGGLFLIPQLEGSLPFVRIFWLLGLGVLFLQRWPGGMPPAWATGTALPWPSQQQLREQRAAAQAERGSGGLAEKARRPRRGRAEPPETPAPEPPPSKPHSSSKKKRRKRR